MERTVHARRVIAALRRLRRCERGMTLTELLVSMAIMSVVLAGIVAMFTSGVRTESDLNLRFQSQADGRVALDALRRDVHNACSATVSGGTTVTLYTINGASPSYPCTVVSATWCTSGSGTKYGLYRSAASATCTSANQLRADYLTSGSIFTVITASGQLPQIGVDFTVNRRPAITRLKYRLDDAIALRNARRV